MVAVGSDGRSAVAGTEAEFGAEAEGVADAAGVAGVAGGGVTAAGVAEVWVVVASSGFCPQPATLTNATRAMTFGNVFMRSQIMTVEAD